MRFHGTISGNLSGSSRRQALVAGLALATLAAVAPAAGPWSQPAAAAAQRVAGSGAGWHATEVFPLSRGLDNPALTLAPDDFYGLSCPRPGTCVAAGWYQRRSKNPQWPFGQFRPVTGTQSNGAWGDSKRLWLPSTKIDPDAGAQINAISCPTPDWCAAAGLIPTADARNQYAFVITESGGQWNRPRLVQLPPNPQRSPAISELDGISCAAPGSCVAVGWYITRAVNYVPIVVTDSGGHWQRAIGLPAHLSPGPNLAELSAVSCPTARWCVAVGSDTHGQASQDEAPLATVFSAGRWQRPAPPLGAREGSLASVGCRAVGDCVAVGGGYEVLEHGRWQRGGGAVPVPADGSPPADNPPDLTAVSCTPGACLAGGRYFSDTGHDFPAFVVSYSGGKWRDPVRIRLPRNAVPPSTDGPPPAQSLNAVSCTTSCTAVGTYTTTNGLEPNWAAAGPG